MSDKSRSILFFILSGILCLPLNNISAQQIIHMDLETAVDMAMQKSYLIRLVELGVRRSNFLLKSEQAGLRTQIYMNLKTPDLRNISDYKWDSNLGRDVLVRENTRLWQSEVSVRQPLILGSFPTNGYFSLNYRFYQYQQRYIDEIQTDFYNRFYLKFEQPFFLPNVLKNSIEDAELNLQDNKLEFIADQMDILEEVAEDYYDLFNLSYNQGIYSEEIRVLEKILHIAQVASRSDSVYQMDVNQILLRLNNVRENMLSAGSELRAETADMRQKLRLHSEDTLRILTPVRLDPIAIDLEEAIKFGLKNNPELRRSELKRRRSEIELENQKGENAFHLTLEVTYGLERKNQDFMDIWDRYDNSNSITVNAYVPIWDSGERRYRLQAEELSILQRELEIVEKQEDIRKDIENEYISMNEYYERALNMQESIELAEKIRDGRLDQYIRGRASIDELLQTIANVRITHANFLDIYLEYRNSLLDLMSVTYYDFEKDIPLVDAFEQKFSAN